MKKLKRKIAIKWMVFIIVLQAEGFISAMQSLFEQYDDLIEDLTQLLEAHKHSPFIDATPLEK